MTHKKHWLLLILVVYAVLGVAYSWVVPLGESPDEVDHFLYVRYLIEQHTFPVMHPVAADNETMEANQPPLFYLLNAAVTAPFPITASADFPLNACFTFNPHDGGRAHFYLHEPAEQRPFAPDFLAFRVARLVSVMLGAITVWLAYRLGRQLTPADERVGLLAAGILAFNPQFVFITASVNNDVLTAVIGAALVCFSVEAVHAPSLRRFVGVGILVGLGLLTKFALIAFWPLPLLAALLSFRNGRWPAALRNSAIVIGIPLLLAGWWYIRANQLYGDPLAWEVHLQAKGAEVLRTSVLTLADLREFAVIHFQSYWAWFGWLKIQTAGWVYWLLALGVLLASVGLVFVLRHWLQQVWAAGIANWHDFLHKHPVVTALLFNILAVAAIYVSLLRYIQTINWSGYQGRLAYAAAAPIAALLALGWWHLVTFFAKERRVGTVVSVLLGLSLLLLSLVSLAQLNAAFARPALYTPPASWHRVCQETRNGFYVEAADFPATVLPGEVLTVSVAGYGASRGQISGEIALLNWEGTVLDTAVYNLDWQEREIVVDTAVLTVPSDTLPAAARLVYFENEGIVELGQIKIGPTAIVVPEPSYPISANFGDEIALLGYDVELEADQLYLRTYWQALQSMFVDYTIFVHVQAQAGNLIEQQDAQPQAGRYPTSIWDMGEIVVGETTLTLPADAKPAQLAIGLYQLDTLVRLPLVGEVRGETAVNQTDQLIIKLNR